MTPTIQVIDSLRTEPELWEQTRYTLNHKNGTEVWTANGFWFLKIYKPNRNINFIEKLRLNSAIKRWNRRPLVVSS